MALKYALPALPNIAAPNHMWIFKWKFKFITGKFKMFVLLLHEPLSRAQQPCVSDGCYVTAQLEDVSVFAGSSAGQRCSTRIPKIVSFSSEFGG